MASNDTCCGLCVYQADPASYAGDVLFPWPRDTEDMPHFAVARHFLSVCLPSFPLEVTEDGDLKTVDIALVNCKWFKNDGDHGAVEPFKDQELEVPALKAKSFADRESGSLWPVRYFAVRNFAAEPVTVLEHPNVGLKNTRLIACYRYCQFWEYAPAFND